MPAVKLIHVGSVRFRDAPQTRFDVDELRERTRVIRAAGTKTTGRFFQGIASRSVPNSHGYCLLARGCSIKLPIPVYWSHEKRGRIGEVIAARKMPDHIEVCARLDDNEVGDKAWDLIDRGFLGALSGAAEQKSWRAQGVIDGVTYYDRWALREVSICAKGACPGAVITDHWQQ